MVLTDKLLSNKLVLLDKLSFPEAKTKHVAEVFQTLRKKFPELGRDQLLVLPAKDETVERAIRNLPDVALSRADSLNVVDLLREDGLVMLKDAVGVVEHTYHTLRQKNDTGRGSNTK
jgi:large subunit ribosomal protein L4